MKHHARAYPIALLFTITGLPVFVQGQVVLAPLVSSTSFSGAGPSGASGTANQKPHSSRLASAFTNQGPLITRGMFHISPSLQYRWLYSDGLQTNPGSTVSSTVETLSPAVDVQIGTHFLLKYIGTWTTYSSREFSDNFGQSASLSGQYSPGDWNFEFSQSYTVTSDTLYETSRQSESTVHATNGSATYRLGDRTRLQLTASRSLRLVNATSDAPEWVSADWDQWLGAGWLNYLVSEKVDMGVGIEIGYANLSVGSDFRSVRPQVRASWRPTSRITVTAQAGTDYVHFEDGGAGDIATPTYSGSIAYQPTSTTTLTASANRSLSASYYANFVTRSRTWTAGLSQRLLQRFFLSSNYTEGTTHYIASSAGAISGRIDRVSAFGTSLSTPVLRKGSISILFQSSRSRSNNLLYTANSNQYGFEFAYRF